MCVLCVYVCCVYVGEASPRRRSSPLRPQRTSHSSPSSPTLYIVCGWMFLPPKGGPEGTVSCRFETDLRPPPLPSIMTEAHLQTTFLPRASGFRRGRGGRCWNFILRTNLRAKRSVFLEGLLVLALGVHEPRLGEASVAAIFGRCVVGQRSCSSVSVCRHEPGGFVGISPDEGQFGVC